MTTSGLLESGIKANLDGRAASWRRYLGGEIPLDLCMDAVVQCMGYPSGDALMDDYGVARTESGAKFDPTLLNDRWKRALADPNSGWQVRDPARLLRALMAFAYRQGGADFQVVVTPHQTGVNAEFFWVCQGKQYASEISLAAAKDLFTAAGFPGHVPLGFEALHFPAPFGFMNAQCHSVVTGQTLTIRGEICPPERLGTTPEDIEAARPFMAALMAQQRADRANTPDVLSTRRIRLRS